MNSLKKQNKTKKLPPTDQPDPRRTQPGLLGCNTGSPLKERWQMESPTFFLVSAIQFKGIQSEESKKIWIFQNSQKINKTTVYNKQDNLTVQKKPVQHGLSTLVSATYLAKTLLMSIQKRQIFFYMNIKKYIFK